MAGEKAERIGGPAKLTKLESQTQTSIHPPASLHLFGFRPSAARVEIVPRTPDWRMKQAAMGTAVPWVLMPFVFFVPPHVPWVLIAFGYGMYQGYRKWTEHYTITEFQGSCPKCDTPQKLNVPARFTSPMHLHCEGCNHRLDLRADLPEGEG